MNVHVRVADAEFVAGVVIARGVRVGPASAELSRMLDELIARRAGEEFPPAAVKEAVRRMLRNGGFRPSGRNKPASEYLAQAAREGRFPRINNLVDVNNLVSLEHGLPISLLDLDALTDDVELRSGREGEKYVFNSAGQEIDLAGLVCACRVEGPASVPLGNPVKDSMEGKIKDGTSGVVGVIYGTMAVTNEAKMRVVVEHFGQLLTQFGGAGVLEHLVARSSM